MVQAEQKYSRLHHILWQKKNVTEDLQTYDKGINIPSLKRNWPDGHDLPQMIVDIATLLKPMPWGAVGYFEMPGARFNDYWIENGADLWSQFGMFLKFADGTEVAQWFHEEAVPDAEPIVLIGSEGDLSVVAPNLKSFMLDWAKGHGVFDLALSEEDRTPERLAQFDKIAAKMLEVIHAAPDHPPSSPGGDIAGFIEKFGAAARAGMAEDPVLREIAKVMDAHIPRGREAWEYYNIQINIVGPRIEFLPNALPPDYKERAPLPERDALIPLVLKAREARAQGQNAVRGLWHSASLRISPDGLVHIPADWDSEPRFETGGRVTRAELNADLARFPRSERWRMLWMDELT